MNDIHCDKSLDAAVSFCIGVAQRNLDCNLGTYILWYFFVQIYFMQRSILLAYVCVPYICSAQGGQKRVSDALELELGVVGTTMWILKPRSSTRIHAVLIANTRLGSVHS